jgi:hypothetical protein
MYIMLPIALSSTLSYHKRALFITYVHSIILIRTYKIFCKFIKRVQKVLNVQITSHNTIYQFNIQLITI